MWVSTYFVWFVFYSVFGWVYESTYCTIVERKWENRGFLYGPCCPIYGTGITAMLILWQHLTEAGITATWYQIFLVSFFGSAVLEYTTHWTLEKLFHAYWWDYSNMPFNINGRICLPASTLFGLGGLLVVYVLYEPTLSVTAKIGVILMELLSLVLAAIMSADTAITVAALNRIARAAAAINRSVNDHMDKLVAEAVQRSESAAQELHERGAEAAHVLTSAADSILETGNAVAEQLTQGVMPADDYAQERERYEAEMSDRLLGGMNHYVRAAARRVKGLSPAIKTAEVPGEKQLERLMRDVHAKHWKTDDSHKHAGGAEASDDKSQSEHHGGVAA